MLEASSDEDGPSTSHSDSEFNVKISKTGLDILQNMRRVIRAVDKYSRKLHSGIGLTGPQLHCLATLCDIGPMSQKELSEIVHVGASTVTGVIDRLEANDLVERRRDPKDRRKAIVAPKEAGRRMRAEAPSLLQGRLARNLEQLPKDEQQEIASGLRKLVSLMEADNLASARESQRMMALHQASD